MFGIAAMRHRPALLLFFFFFFRLFARARRLCIRSHREEKWWKWRMEMKYQNLTKNNIPACLEVCDRFFILSFIHQWSGLLLLLYDTSTCAHLTSWQCQRMKEAYSKTCTMHTEWHRSTNVWCAQRTNERTQSTMTDLSKVFASSKCTKHNKKNWLLFA